MGYRLWGRREEEGREGRDILRALTLVAGWRAVHSRDGDCDDSVCMGHVCMGSLFQS